MSTVAVNAEGRTAASETHTSARLTPWQRGSGGERILLGSPELAAGAGIGYAFLWLVELVFSRVDFLVQTIALLGAGVERLA